MPDKDIMKVLDVSASMVAKTRQRCVQEGSEAAYMISRVQVSIRS